MTMTTPMHTGGYLPIDWSDQAQLGEQLHRFLTLLFPLNRSLTGEGVRQTLSLIRQHCLPDLTIHEVESGTTCFDWTVPDEWNVQQAYIVGPDGSKVVDFKDHNLHLVGYSEPVRCTLSLAELQPPSALLARHAGCHPLCHFLLQASLGLLPAAQGARGAAGGGL